MGINSFLVFQNSIALSNILIGVSIASTFFHIGFINDYVTKRAGLIGIIYGFTFFLTSLVSGSMGISAGKVLWFIPNIALIFLLYTLKQADHIKNSTINKKIKHTSFPFEIVRFSIFLVCFMVFLMLGVLGVHELGHNLSAKALGCMYETKYDLMFGKTDIVCDSEAPVLFITLSGLAITLIVSVALLISGNNFMSNSAILLISFSVIEAFSDLKLIGTTPTMFLFLGGICFILLLYGTYIIVKEYWQEYTHTENMLRNKR